MELLAKIHPLIVHFPIALFTVYTLLEMVAFFYKNEHFSRFKLIILGIGVLSSVGAVLTGNSAAGITAGGISAEAKESMEMHQLFATAVMIFYAALFFAKIYLASKKKLAGRIKYLFPLLVLIGIIFIYFAGYYGGELVFKYGIGTEVVKMKNEELRMKN